MTTKPMPAPATLFDTAPPVAWAKVGEADDAPPLPLPLAVLVAMVVADIDPVNVVFCPPVIVVWDDAEVLLA